MTTKTAMAGQSGPQRTDWASWAALCGARFEQKQWLLSKYEGLEVDWPAEKIARFIAHIKERLHLEAGRRLVDLCCGGGWIGGHLVGQGVSVVGVDYAAPMIEIARRCWPTASFTVADATQCPLPDGSVDAVLCYFALINIRQPDRQQAIVDEIHRVLKPGGRALIGHLPLAGTADLYDRAKARYLEHAAVDASPASLVDTFRPEIVLFSPDKIEAWGRRFSESWIEHSFNHFWYPGAPPTADWLADLCLMK